MSREEAATIYLEKRSGFHGGFFEFQEARTDSFGAGKTIDP
jgi:hypothetical protein